jgi:hypothetical protein
MEVRKLPSPGDQLQAAEPHFCRCCHRLVARHAEYLRGDEAEKPVLLPFLQSSLRLHGAPVPEGEYVMLHIITLTVVTSVCKKNLLIHISVVGPRLPTLGVAASRQPSGVYWPSNQCRRHATRDPMRSVQNKLTLTEPGHWRPAMLVRQPVKTSVQVHEFAAGHSHATRGTAGRLRVTRPCRLAPIMIHSHHDSVT